MDRNVPVAPNLPMAKVDVGTCHGVPDYSMGDLSKSDVSRGFKTSPMAEGSSQPDTVRDSYNK